VTRVKRGLRATAERPSYQATGGYPSHKSLFRLPGHRAKAPSNNLHCFIVGVATLPLLAPALAASLKAHRACRGPELSISEPPWVNDVFGPIWRPRWQYVRPSTRLAHSHSFPVETAARAQPTWLVCPVRQRRRGSDVTIHLVTVLKGIPQPASSGFRGGTSPMASFRVARDTDG
jgi:hypothetical protein